MKVEILFIKKQDFLGRVISFLSKGSYSHCCLCFDNLIILETDFIHDLNLIHLKYNKCDYDSITLNLKPYQYDDLMIWATEHIGCKYDNWQNIRWLLRMKGNGQVKLNCVESVIDMLIFINLINPIYLEMNLNPTQLYEVLKLKQN